MLNRKPDKLPGDGVGFDTKKQKSGFAEVKGFGHCATDKVVDPGNFVMPESMYMTGTVGINPVLL